MSTQFEPLEDASTYLLTEQRRARILSEQMECTFCWTNRDGHPIAITQAFVHADGVFWMVSEQSRARVRAVRRDPRSSVVVTAVGKSKSLSYKGHTTVLDDRETVLRVLREIARRYDPEDLQAQDAHVAAADSPGRVVLKFVPEKITNAFDAGLARRRSS
jgi:general stress protein 26